MSELEVKETKTREQRDRETIFTLARQFVRGDMLEHIDVLQERAAEMAAEWEEEGHVRAFVGKEGDLLVLGINKEGGWERLRASFDSKIVDVTIPPELQPQPLRLRCSNEMVLYDTTDAENDTLPLGMDALIKKFGERLSYMAPGCVVLNGRYYELDDVSLQVERLQDHRIKSEREARAIENKANRAAASVRKGLFMTAEKYTALREQAYRHEIRAAGSRSR